MKPGNYKTPWRIAANPDQDAFENEKTGKRSWWLHKGLKRKTVIIGFTSLWKARCVTDFFFFFTKLFLQHECIRKAKVWWKSGHNNRAAHVSPVHRRVAYQEWFVILKRPKLCIWMGLILITSVCLLRRWLMRRQHNLTAEPLKMPNTKPLRSIMSH